MRRILHVSTLLTTIALGATLVLTSACGDGTATIGVIVPETGGYASYGTSLRKGIEVAAEQLAATPSFSMELDLRYYNSASDPAKAAELLEKAYRDGANVVIGGATSDEALRMTGVADKFDRILVSPSASSPDLTGITSNFYRIFPSDLLEANKLASFTADLFDDDRRIVVLAQQDAYGDGIQRVFHEEFEKLEGKVVETIPLPQGSGDLSGIADAVRDLDVPGVLIAGYDANVADAIRALRASNFQGTILTTSAFGTPAGLERAGRAAEGVLLTQVVFDVDSDYAHVKRFVDAYKAKFDETPDIYSAHGYDAVMVVAEAMRDRPQLHGELLKGFRAIKEFPGVTGSIQFDERGDVTKFPRVYQIQGGTMVNYDEMVRQRRDEIEQRRRELQERLKRLSRQGGSGGP